jgi:toxin ParE1/3/4
MRIRYTETALAEIDAIFSYIEADNPAAAAAVKARIEHTIGLIGRFPKIGRVKYQQIVRMLPARRYPQYLIFYAIEGDEVVILNVRHGTRRTPWDEQD